MLNLLLGSTIDIDLAGQAVDQDLAGAQFQTFGDFLSRILSLILIVAGLMLLLYMIWGAINWMSAGGDSGKVQKARDQITQAVIGLVVLLSTLAIFNLLQTFFGFEIITYDRTTRIQRAAQQATSGQLDTKQLENIGNEALQSDQRKNLYQQGQELLKRFSN